MEGPFPKGAALLFSAEGGRPRTRCPAGGAAVPSERPGCNPCARPCQINPRESKLDQTDPNKIAWFNLVSFVRIGAFQWVMANPNKNFLVSISGCAWRV